MYNWLLIILYILFNNACCFKSTKKVFKLKVSYLKKSKKYYSNNITLLKEINIPFVNIFIASENRLSSCKVWSTSDFDFNFSKTSVLKVLSRFLLLLLYQFLLKMFFSKKLLTKFCWLIKNKLKQNMFYKLIKC